MAWRIRSRQNIQLGRRKVLGKRVQHLQHQRLPSREHTGLHRCGQHRPWHLHRTMAHHRVPRERLSLRLPEREQCESSRGVKNGAVDRERPRSLTHAHRELQGQASLGSL
jgi:hypothetical protein